MKKKEDFKIQPVKVRRIMMQNEEVGRVDASCPLILSKATELFLNEVLQKALVLAQKKGSKSVSRFLIEQAVAEMMELEIDQDFENTSTNCSSVGKREDIFVDDENGNV